MATQDGSDCVYTSLIGNPDVGAARISNYVDIMQTYNYTMGSFHIAALSVYVSYIVISILRKHRMSRFQWLNLINLCIIELLTIIK